MKEIRSEPPLLLLKAGLGRPEGTKVQETLPWLLCSPSFAISRRRELRQNLTRANQDRGGGSKFKINK